LHSKKNIKLVPSKTRQKIAKNAQNADSVTAFNNTIDSQNRIEIICPPQNTALFRTAGTLL